MTFTCERCHHDSQFKHNLILHLQRKQECPTTWSNASRESLVGKLTKKPINENSVTCEGCNKIVHKAGLARHRKSCKGKFVEKDKVIETLQKEVAELKHIVNEMRTSSSSIVPTGNVTQTTNNNTTINGNNTQNNIENQQINITINNFGEESTQHLTPEFLRNCILNPTREFKNLITEIHYNPDVPENHNLRFKSSKRNTFEKYITPSWQECDATNTLEELIRKGYRILNAHYMEHMMNDPQVQENETTMRMFERFRILSDKQSLEYNAVKRDLRVLVKDRTAFLLAAPDTHVDEHVIESIAQEVVNTV